MTEEKNPFTNEELDKLFDARWYRDVDYVFDWTKRAVKWYEQERNKFIRLLESTARKES